MPSLKMVSSRHLPQDLKVLPRSPNVYRALDRCSSQQTGLAVSKTKLFKMIKKAQRFNCIVVFYKGTLITRLEPKKNLEICLVQNFCPSVCQLLASAKWLTHNISLQGRPKGHLTLPIKSVLQNALCQWLMIMEVSKLICFQRKAQAYICLNKSQRINNLM